MLPFSYALPVFVGEMMSFVFTVDCSMHVPQIVLCRALRCPIVMKKVKMKLHLLPRVIKWYYLHLANCPSFSGIGLFFTQEHCWHLFWLCKPYWNIFNYHKIIAVPVSTFKLLKKKIVLVSFYYYLFFIIFVFWTYICDTHFPCTYLI